MILNCFSKNKNNCLVKKVHNVVNGLCLITIIGLSAAILIVFTIMSELRNLNGTLIVCYVLAVLIAHINELTVYYILNCENCSVEYIRNISFSNYFGHMHVLFWSNVNCFDVMLTYGWGFITYIFLLIFLYMLFNRQPIMDCNSKKKFILYAVYAIGGSTMLSISIFIDYLKISPYNIISLGKSKWNINKLFV